MTGAAAPEHKKLLEYVPIARSMTKDAFAARFDHPFLFGREVLEEEFRFQTLVTKEQSLHATSAEDGRKSTDVFRIRHWLIPVKKPEGKPAADRVFIGRGETNDIWIPHKTVSKLHGYFLRDPRIVTRWFLVDTGSANGTKHNGLRIPPRARVALVDGDTINFGRCVFQWLTARSLYDRLMAANVEQSQPGQAESEDDFDLPH